MATIREIPFRDIPHQSALFLDYIDFSPRVLRFYNRAPTIANLERFARVDCADLQFPRTDISSILRRQNKSYGADSETLRRIEELEKPGCVAIVTGQQVGLFAGPLYTIYKALSSVKIAEEMNKRGIRAVAIFWMETEDHDLPEVTHRTLLDRDSILQTIDYREVLFKGSGTPHASVGSLELPQSIREAVCDFLNRLPDSSWKQEIQHQLDSTYKPGATFALSFARLLSQLFRGSGLILFDPHDPGAKKLVRDVIRKSLRESEPLRAALLERNRDLETAGFHSQVSILDSATLLFLFANGERYALESRDSGFALKNSNRIFSLDELLTVAEKTPERFSPNVLLRPIIQDHLFPTIAYVGGSAEVAYFAQIEVLYRMFGRPMPIIWPRDSLTLIEPRIADEMDRLKITIQDCFRDKPLLTEKALRNSGSSQTSSEVEELQKHLDQGLNAIRPELHSVDPTLARAMETARRKILYNVQRLKSQAIRLEATQNSRISKAVDLLLNNCYPNGTLQERQLGIQHFWARYGPSVLDDVRASLPLGVFSHHVLRLEDKG
ncbi:MAG: bacillithiol biosynthesis cysteine-adding enzyme BshC [Acidobacteria bacterium]|nr:bacillithiol biosynthesis cysteine-adding enzyme BshC [Acidobacteriota bacterium]